MTALSAWDPLEPLVAARNRATSQVDGRARRAAWFSRLMALRGRWASPVPGDPEGTARWIRNALEAWAGFLAWAKWWETQVSREAGVPMTHPALPSGPRARMTILLLTKNEEARLPGCLESVRWADEIVVVDGESRDRTVEIARAAGAVVVVRPFSGSFAQERNAGLDTAGGDWVLQMDADETVSPQLREAIGQLLQQGSPHAALKIRRRNYFLGRRMRYGGWYHYNLVLFRRAGGRYDGLVHERLAVQGTIGELPGDLIHRPFDSLAQFVDRQNRYTTLQARELLQRQDRPDQAAILQQLRRRPLKIWWKLYVKKQGFRDGMRGLVFSALFAWVEFLLWAKCWEACHNSGAWKVER